MTTTVEGTNTAQFEPVRSALEQLLESGQDYGASVAVVVGGELVADLWGGHLDTARTEPWQRDTIVNVFSTSKTMTNLCALILADRGDLDVDAPVERYWPEFKANGKEGVLVRHLLAHTSGLSGWDEPMGLTEVCDWERCTTLLAAQSPWWEPGTMSGYHALTQGYLVGEVVRRVTGQTLGEFLAREVAGPLGADFHIGTAAEHDARVAPLLDPQIMRATDLPPGASDADSRHHDEDVAQRRTTGRGLANDASGGAPRSPQPTVTATRDLSPRSSRSCRTWAPSTARGCFPKPAAGGSSNRSRTESTPCWASQFASASATGCPARRPRSRAPTRASGAAGAARWWSTISTLA